MSCWDFTTGVILPCLLNFFCGVLLCAKTLFRLMKLSKPWIGKGRRELCINTLTNSLCIALTVMLLVWITECTDR